MLNATNLQKVMGAQRGASRSYQESALMLLEPNLKRQELTKWNNIIGLALIRLLEQRDQWEEGPGNGERLGALRTLREHWSVKNMRVNKVL